MGGYFTLATKSRYRYWEIDSLRGVVVITMIIFHLMWDLWFFRVLPDIVLWAGFWKYFQRFTACTFLILVGVSLAVRHRRMITAPVTDYLWRGLRIFGWGVVFSLAAWYFGVGYVHFGVLHLIGFAIMAAWPLLPYSWFNIGLWVLFTILGAAIETISIETWGLVWLGLRPPDYAPLDYFPVLPWFGVVVLGIGIGNLLYREDGRIFALPDLSGFLLIRFLRFLGSHSLIIYMVHQPILFVILMALGIADI